MPESNNLTKVIKDELAKLQSGFVSKSDVDKMSTDLAAKFEAANTEQTAELVKVKEELEKFQTMVKESLPENGKDQKSLDIEFGDREVKTSIQNFMIYDDGKNADLISKAITTNINIPGAPTTSLTPFYTLQYSNPFRSRSTVMSVGDGNTMSKPSISGVNWKKQTDAAAAIPDGLAQMSNDVTIDPYVSQTKIPNFNLDSLAGQDAAIVGLMAAMAPVAETADMINVLKSASSGGGKVLNHVVKSGVANDLPADDDILDSLWAMTSGLGTAYLAGGSFLISRQVMSLLRTVNKNGLVFDPTTGLQTLFGYNIMQTDGFPSGKANNDVSAVFGNYRLGTILATKQMMTISRFLETNPGFVTYFGQMGFKGAIWDPSAISTLISGAA